MVALDNFGCVCFCGGNFVVFLINLAFFIVLGRINRKKNSFLYLTTIGKKRINTFVFRNEDIHLSRGGAAR